MNKLHQTFAAILQAHGAPSPIERAKMLRELEALRDKLRETKNGERNTK